MTRIVPGALAWVQLATSGTATMVILYCTGRLMWAMFGVKSPAAMGLLLLIEVVGLTVAGVFARVALKEFKAIHCARTAEEVLQRKADGSAQISDGVPMSEHGWIPPTRVVEVDVRPATPSVAAS
jgi:hypothetical protein